MRIRNHGWILRVGLGMILACLGLGSLSGQEKADPPERIEVFVYPKKLTSKDKLTGADEVIDIKSDTVFIWVDLMPDARYGHPTEFILISTAGTRVVKSEMWPELNGEALFRDCKQFKVNLPLHLSGKSIIPSSPDFLKQAKVYVYPTILTPKDKLNDMEQIIAIKSDTILVWADLASYARFAHPTEYLLISATGTRVVKGAWWPTLNGKDLICGNDHQVEFPLQVILAPGSDVAAGKEPSKVKAPKAEPAKGKSSVLRLKGMKDALADIENGSLKQKQIPPPAPPWYGAYLQLLKKECGVYIVFVNLSRDEELAEMGGYNDIMPVEIEHRYGKGILEQLHAKAMTDFEAKRD